MAVPMKKCALKFCWYVRVCKRNLKSIGDLEFFVEHFLAPLTAAFQHKKALLIHIPPNSYLLSQFHPEFHSVLHQYELILPIRFQ